MLLLDLVLTLFLLWRLALQVAVKTMAKEYVTWKEAVELREIQCLLRLSHPNIVALLQVRPACGARTIH